MHANVLALALSVAAVEPYELPPGSMVTELLDGPGGTAVAFYVEPLPSRAPRMMRFRVGGFGLERLP